MGGSAHLMLLSSALGCSAVASSVGRSRCRLAPLLVCGTYRADRALEDALRTALTAQRGADCSQAICRR